MASILYYVSSSAAVYYMGSTMINRSIGKTLEWVMNTHANPNIGEVCTVKSVFAMLDAYKHIKDTHPAFESLSSVRNALIDLQTAIERAQLRCEAHKAGYISRFRTFDATTDNLVIEKLSRELMRRLEVFTQLVKLPDKI